MKKIFYYSFIMSVLVLSGANFAQADALDTFQSVTKPDRTVYTLLEPLPCVPTAKNNCAIGSEIKTFTVNQFIEYVFKFAIALAVLLATIQVIIGGFQYMGNDSYSSKSAAKARFWDAGKGLAGALVSFLILQTIDPRLVQVNTEIQPICTKEMQSDPNSICSTEAVASFKGQLDKDLKALSTSNLNQVAALQAEIDSRKKRIDELNLKNSGEEGLTAPELVELEQLKQQVSEAQTLQTKIIATGTANGYFRNAIGLIHTADQYDRNGVLNQYSKTTIDLEKSQITTAYNNYINSPGIDGATKNDLICQRDFYLAQVDKEVGLISNVTKFGNTPATNVRSSGVGAGPGNTGTTWNVVNPAYAPAKNALKDAKAEYAKQLDFLNSTATVPPAGIDTNLAQVKKNSIILDQYKTTITDRIRTIDNSLATKP